MAGKLRELTRIALGISAGFAMTGCGLTSYLGFETQGSAQAEARHPDYSADMRAAREAFARGNYGIAIAHLEGELASRPSSVAALNGLGSSYDRLGRYAVAQRYYFRALDLAPEPSLTVGNIGYSYLLQGRREEAAQLLRLALHYDATNTVAAGNLGLATETPAAVPPEIAFIDLAASGERPSRQLSEPELTDVTLTVAEEPDPVSTPALDGKLRIEISNGNGVNGMAARLRGFLQGKGGRVVRLTNADDFDHEKSTVYYRGGQRKSAEALAAAFPSRAIVLQQSDRLADWVDARLLIGRDFSDFEAESERGETLVQLTQ